MQSKRHSMATQAKERHWEEVAGICRISPGDIDDIYPCAPIQIAIMAHPDEHLYKVMGEYTLAHHLDLDRIILALQQVYSLNTILRTRIVHCELGLVQVVVKSESDFYVKRPDVSPEQWVQHEMSAPMHFGMPLFRVAIVERKLVLTIHHAIMDAWSHAAFMTDLWNVYHGRDSQPHAEYKSFVEKCVNIDEADAESFWSQRFSGQPTVFPEAETEYTPHPTATLRKEITFRAGSTVSQALIPSYLEAAWALTAVSYTNAESAVYGFVISGRAANDNIVDSTLGPTIVTIPVQANYDPRSTLRDFVKERGQQRRIAQTSHYLQYGQRKIRSVNQAAEIAGAYTALLNFTNHPEGPYSKDFILELDKMDDFLHGTTCLDMLCWLRPEGLSMKVKYDPQVVSERQLGRILNQFDHILQLLLCSPPTMQLGKLDLLSPQDRVEILGWNRNIPEVPKQHLHQMFKIQVDLQPTEPAVMSFDGSATYAQLDDMSSRLAHELRRCGVREDKAVALVIEKSLLAIVSFLAVMKAGGVCVPIEPQLPYHNQQSIVSHVKAVVVLTSDSFAEKLAGLPSNVLKLDTKSILQMPVTYELSSYRKSPGQAAYILFTSGSTGAPKGVVLEHRNLVASLHAYGKHHQLMPGVRVLQFAAYVWGASVIEMFGTLMFGGCICMPSQQERESGLATFITSNQIDFAILTPTVIRTIQPEEVPTLKTLLTAGEPISVASVHTWASKIRFCNGWGLSETGVGSAFANVKPASLDLQSIGTPVGCAIWLVHPNDPNRLLPIGAKGELLVEGPAVARGYLANESKTSSTFIRPPAWAPNQWSGFRKMHRMCRTGDLAKYNPDGSIHYIGRGDSQVKLRGQRFDLGEVEDGLHSCAIVRDAFAVVQETEGGKNALIAVLTFIDDQIPCESILQNLGGAHEATAASHVEVIRKYLTSKMPNYMVPTVLLAVERLPRTASSKLDRRSIREWLAQQDLKEATLSVSPSETESMTAPATDTERKLQSIESEVLSLPEDLIGRESSLIKLGGDSIIAMEVASKCRKEGIDVTVAELMQTSSLAEVAEKCRVVDGYVYQPSLQVMGNETAFPLNDSQVEQLHTYISSIGIAITKMQLAFPCTPVQEGILFAQLKGTGHEYWDQVSLKVTSLDASKPVNVEQTAEAWRALCAAQPMLRTIFTSCIATSENAFQQIVLAESNPTIFIAPAASQKATSTLLDTFEIPNLTAADPPHAIYLTQVSATVVHAKLYINHVLIDNRSIGLICEQLSEYISGKAGATNIPNISNYVAWLQRRQKPALEHWTKYLKGVQPCLVSTQPQNSRIQTGVIGDLEVSIQNARGIHAFCQQNNITAASLLQAVWGIVLHLYTGVKSPTFGCMQSQHGLFDSTDAVIAPLLAMIVSKFDITPSKSVLDTLHTEQKDAINALENSGCSLSSIHEAIGLGSDSLFNTVMTIVRLWADDGITTDHIKVKSSLLDENPTEYAVTIGVGYSNEKFLAKMWYNTSEISESSATQIVQTFESIIPHMIQAPEQTIEGLTKHLESSSTMSNRTGVPDETSGKVAGQCEIRPSRLEEVYPCSPLQQQRISASVLQSNHHLDQYVFSIMPHVSMAKLDIAWNTVINTLPVLRTRIAKLEDESVWQTATKAGPDWEEDDSLEKYLQWDKTIPARYGRPLCRIGKIMKSDHERYIVLSLSKAICDDWTSRLVVDFVEQAYHDASLPGWVPFSNHMRHMSHRSQAHVQRFWSTRLEGARDALLFPHTISRDSGPEFTTERSLDIKLPKPQHDSPITVLLRAAWALCLARLTGESKICFGSQVNQCDEWFDGIASVAGPVAAVVPCFMDLDKTEPGTALLQSIQAYITDVTPFLHNTVQQGQPVNEDIQAAHAFNNILIINSSQSANRSERPKVLELIRKHCMPETAVDVGLLTTCEMSTHNVFVNMQFNERAIPSTRVELVLRQFEHAVLQLHTDPTAELSRLDPLSHHETSLLATWNHDLPLPATSLVLDQIKKCVLEDPDACAVCSWDYNLDYKQLDDLSDRFATFLQAKHVKAGTMVAYFFEKSTAAIVAKLGIMKAGGVLLPMDATHPPERIVTMLSESKASIMMLSPSFFNKVNSVSQEKLSIDMEFIYALPAGNLTGDLIRPENPCYVIYTSGSTGNPKGIVVTHENLATSISSMVPRMGLTKSTRGFQFVKFNFDAAMYDVFMMLTIGACICVPSETEWSNDLAGAIQRTQANYSFMTPSMAGLLTPKESPTIRRLIVGGEASTRDLFERWTSVSLLNAYGPTETTIMSSCCEVDSSPGREINCIGYPAGCRYWVVSPDDHNQLVSIGRPGELLIEGPIVSRGYLQRPELTTAVFITPPAWTKEYGSLSFSQNWYKTGDVVTQNVDGTITHRGRKDTQIKMRGQRIELGEIESHLGRLAKPMWTFAIECVRPDGGKQDPCLMAFYKVNTTGSDSSLTTSPAEMLRPLTREASEARKLLAGTVPEYMVPQFFVHLNNFPYTSSGKLDRKVLRKIGASLSPGILRTYNLQDVSQGENEAMIVSSSKTEPLSSDQLELQQLWSQVLSVPRDSIKAADSFFSRGGNSIRAMRLANSARKAGISLTVSDVLKTPILSDMAMAMSSLSTVTNGHSISSNADRSALDQDQLAKWSSCVEVDNIESVAKATDWQAWTFAVGEMDGKGFHNQALLKFENGVDTAQLVRACETTIKHHPILRTVFLRDGAKLHQVALKSPPFSLVTTEETSTVPRKAPEKNILPYFTLHSLSDTGRNCHELRIRIHHALYDAISLSTLLQCMTHAYMGRPLPNLPRFHDWISHVESLDKLESERYWRNLLQHSSMTNLGTVEKQISSQDSQTNKITVRVPSSGLDPSYGTTSTIFQAAWALALSYATGSQDVVFGLLSANRNLPFSEIAQVPGPCINILPVRAQCVTNMTLAALAPKLQELAAASIPHHHIGFQDVINNCTDWPPGTRFSSILVYQNHESLGQKIQFGDTECAFSGSGEAGDSADIWVHVEPSSEELMVELLYSRKTVSKEQAEWFTDVLTKLLESPHEVVDGFTCRGWEKVNNLTSRTVANGHAI